MRDATVIQLEDWIERQFPSDKPVHRDEVLRRAKDADLPQQAKALLEELPQVEQRPHDIVNEIERMTGPQRHEGNAGGMNAGSSGEMRPGAYGGPADPDRGGSGSGIHG